VSWVDILSDEYAALMDPPGIDWSKYDESGRELVGTGPDGYRFSYLDEMMAAGSGFLDVLRTLGVTERYRALRDKEGREALTELFQAVQKSGDSVWQALKNGEFFLAADQALAMSGDQFANAVATMGAYAMNGAYLHYDGVLADLVSYGRMSTDEMREHADAVVRIFRTFPEVDRSGGFDALREPRGASGIGFDPVTLFGVAVPAWLIAVLGVAAVLGLVFLLHQVFVASRVQDRAMTLCEKLAETDPDAAVACVKAATDMPNAGLAKLFEPITTVAWLAGVGLVVYIGALSLPHLVRTYKEARA
jgi:hypothetical protein